MPGDRHTLSQYGTATPALSIRARLMMLAVLAIAPLLIDRIRLVEAERSERMAVAGRQALEIARHDIESQQEGLAAARAMLEVAGRSYVAAGARPANVNPFSCGNEKMTRLKGTRMPAQSRAVAAAFGVVPNGKCDRSCSARHTTTRDKKTRLE